MEIFWPAFKFLVTQKGLSIQFIEHNGNYHLKAIDGQFILDCVLPIDPQNEETLDFETNFKASGNQPIQKMNGQGCVVIAPTFEDTEGLTTIWKGHRYITQPEALNIFDTLITTQLKLRGGWYKLLSTGATDEDYVEFSIVDKDNCLGLFSYFGLTPGVDVLELKKFIRTEFINPLDFSRQEFLSNAASEVMAGLYFRVYYYSAGTTPVILSVTEKYHET